MNNFVGQRKQRNNVKQQINQSRTSEFFQMAPKPLNAQQGGGPILDSRVAVFSNLNSIPKATT